MKRINILLIILLAVFSFAAEDQATRSFQEVKPYVDEVFAMQGDGNEISAKLKEKQISASSAAKEIEEIHSKLLLVTAPVEYEKYHQILLDFYEKRMLEYKLLSKKRPVPDSLSTEIKELARQSVLEFIEVGGKFKK